MYAQRMDLLEQTKSSLQELNTTLRSQGDAARARYLSFEPDYDYDSDWIAIVTWEIPTPNGDEWPLEMLDEYRQRAREAVGDTATSLCLFRTPDEICEPGHQRGVALQPA